MIEGLIGPVVPLIAPGRGGRAMLVGSACAVSSDAGAYLVTAGHVVQRVSEGGLFTYCRGAIIPIVGELRTVVLGAALAGSSEDLDFGAIRLGEGGADFRAVDVADLDLSAAPATFSRVAFTGWPASRAKAKVASKSLSAELHALVVDVVADDGYARWSLRPEVHILARFRRKEFVDPSGRSAAIADPHGMSGGGVFGCSRGGAFQPADGAPLLGLIVGFKGRDEYIFGMRMNICVALMCRFDPTVEFGLSDTSRSDPTFQALIHAPLDP